MPSIWLPRLMSATYGSTGFVSSWTTSGISWSKCRMDQIYNSATLTIVNADTCCSNACIPGIEPDTRRSIQHDETICGIRYITTQSDPISEILRTNWSTRGWTYQEVFLSSRCLVFTNYQSYFQCKSDVWCEDSCSNGGGMEEQNMCVGNALCHLPELHPEMERCSFYQFVDAVEAFSRRLTLETDSLWAFTGVTKAFQPQFPDGFTWGLPIGNIDAALPWKPRKCVSGLRAGLHAAILDSDMIRLPFPSWSWVSWGGGVQFDTKCEDVKGLVEWHQPTQYAVNTADPFSAPWDELTDQLVEKCHSLTVMDERALGFLRFTAASAVLEVEAMDSDFIKNCPSADPCLLAHIRTHAGKDLGFIQVTSSWLQSHDRKKCEFILLSTKIENEESETCRQDWVWERGLGVSRGIEHMDGCKHQSTYNIMLIDWKEGPHCTVATRVGITQINKKDWEELESTSKLIVLG
ncbi:uncharacterized protein PAC_14342 [Phialocephala subalpina]|uniref:Heterokaryon incompatibility domain-containing protein n=1 Tax=Phialocephala subalpina TaxID=576137 RepID=A0A1L7XHE0_9HELO|nr:uncharacterized protein PAC_14342 [Phialocephala subalpina]